MSSKSKSACAQTSSSSVQLTSDSSNAKTTRGEKESENLCLVLPALEVFIFSLNIPIFWVETVQ